MSDGKMLEPRTADMVDKAASCRFLEELNSVPVEERPGLARTIQQVVEEMPGAPQITVETKSHTGWTKTEDDEWKFQKHEHLTGMKCTSANGTSVDIYKLPDTIGTRPIQGATEEEKWNNRLRYDDLYSENLKQGHPNGASVFIPEPETK
jgi:hypothetical protein